MFTTRSRLKRSAASLAISIAMAGAGLSGCAQLTHRSEWIGASQGNLDGSDLQYSLPRGIIIVTATNAANALTVSDPTSIVVPDRHARYALRLDPSIIAHDKYVLEVKGGLLESAKSDNLDQSSEIAKTLVQIATEGLKIFSGGRSVRGDGATRSARWAKDSVILDPFSGTGSAGCGIGRGRRSTAVGCLSGLQVTATDIDGGPLPVYSREQLEHAARQCETSLCSRLLRPVRIAVRLGGLVHSEHVIMIPDPGLVVGHDVRRGACIQRITTLTFQKGVLEKYDLDKPSELLGCLKIPLEVLKEIAKIPGALLTFRVEQVNKQNELLEAQKKQLDAITALAQTQANLAGAAQANDARAAAANDARTAANDARTLQQTMDQARKRDEKARTLNAEFALATNICNGRPDPAACKQAYQACKMRTPDAPCTP